MNFYTCQFEKKTVLLRLKKTFYFQNWIKSGILNTKDLYDMNGSFRQIEYFYDKLSNKNNILCEYLILKTVFCKFSKQYQCEKAPYINIKTSEYVLLKGNTYIYFLYELRIFNFI